MTDPTNSTQCKATIVIYVVANGLIVKDGNPESMISPLYVAKTKDDLVKIIAQLSEKLKLT